MVAISVKLRADAANAIREGKSLEYQGLLDRIDEARSSILPMHAAARSPRLDMYFVVQTPDPTTAATLAKDLKEMPFVESAVIKPGEEPA